MRDDNVHASDQDLLQLADGELSRAHAVRIRAHLEVCLQCRVRMAGIESTSLDFAGATNRDLPPAAGPRALLRACLAESASASSSIGRRMYLLAFSMPGVVYASALVLVAILGSAFLFHRPAVNDSNAATFEDVLPNPQLTPGSTREVALSDLCSVQHDDVIRSVPGALERQVLNEYGVSNIRAGDYEVDYLITPGLGGADDIRNLWPQPRFNTTWNSFVKDQLEEYLHQSVCSGKINLAAAQQDVSRDWISAYRKYFHTDEPLRLSSSGTTRIRPLPGATNRL